MLHLKALCGFCAHCFLHVTAGNVHDSIPYLNRLDRQRQRFGFEVSAVGLDAGYFTAGITKGLEDRDIYGVISYRRPTHRKGYFYKREYRYDADTDSYRGPQGQTLIYATTDRNGYRHYHSDSKQCRHCPQRECCTRNVNAKKNRHSACVGREQGASQQSSTDRRWAADIRSAQGNGRTKFC